MSGGIAAYKSADLTSKLVQAGASVSVVLTRAARKFIGKTTFEALTGRPVHTSVFSPSEHYQGEHIGLARRCEILVVAPATADFLARIANGFADDLLSTLDSDRHAARAVGSVDEHRDVEQAVGPAQSGPTPRRRSAHSSSRAAAG